MPHMLGLGTFCRLCTATTCTVGTAATVGPEGHDGSVMAPLAWRWMDRELYPNHTHCWMKSSEVLKQQLGVLLQ